MTEPDDALLERLRRISRDVDPVPALVRDSAYAAFETRNLDDELALLVETETAAVRGNDYGGTFEAGEVSITVQLNVDGSAVTVNGLVSGTAATSVAIQSLTGEVTADVDAHGWFTARIDRSGPYRIRIPGLSTEWFGR